MRDTRPPAGVPRLLGLQPGPSADPETVQCDRCGAPMFRMHAVWRCPSCGFKTDCCGW